VVENHLPFVEPQCIPGFQGGVHAAQLLTILLGVDAGAGFEQLPVEGPAHRPENAQHLLFSMLVRSRGHSSFFVGLSPHDFLRCAIVIDPTFIRRDDSGQETASFVLLEEPKTSIFSFFFVFVGQDVRDPFGFFRLAVSASKPTPGGSWMAMSNRQFGGASVGIASHPLG